MNFRVFALSPIPDIATARANFRLQDLAEKDVAKVLYHQRKQKTGQSEALNWDQLSIAAVAVVRQHDERVHFSMASLENQAEPDLIAHVFADPKPNEHWITWGGQERAMPLLHFRSMKHRLSQDAFWQQHQQGTIRQIDIQHSLGATGAYSPSLSELAQRFHYPGTLGLTEDSVWQAYLAGDLTAVRHYSAYCVINNYLLALEMFCQRGDMRYAQADDLREQLRVQLAHHEDMKTFLQAWELAGEPLA